MLRPCRMSSRRSGARPSAWDATRPSAGPPTSSTVCVGTVRWRRVSLASSWSLSGLISCTSFASFDDTPSSGTGGSLASVASGGSGGARGMPAPPPVRLGPDGSMPSGATDGTLGSGVGVCVSCDSGAPCEDAGECNTGVSASCSNGAACDANVKSDSSGRGLSRAGAFCDALFAELGATHAWGTGKFIAWQLRSTATPPPSATASGSGCQRPTVVPPGHRVRCSAHGTDGMAVAAAIAGVSTGERL